MGSDKPEFAFAVKNYKILKDVKFIPQGVTLVSGMNSNGKSSLISALVTALGNTSKDTQVRHGTAGFSVAMRIGDQKLQFTRENGKTTVFRDKGDGKVENFSKLGREPLATLFPDFPFKKVIYEGTSFFPNFSFQNSVPLFEDISVTDLFSSMFADISRVSERLDGRTSKDADRQASLRKELEQVNVTIKSWEQTITRATETERSLSAQLTSLLESFQTQYGDAPDKVRASLEESRKNHIRRSELSDKLALAVTKLPSDWEAMLSEVDRAERAGILDAYQQVSAMKPLRAVMQEAEAKASRAREQVASVAPILDSMAFLPQMTALREAEAKAQSLREQASRIPDGFPEPDDWRLLSEMHRVEEASGSKREQLAVVEKELEEATAQLAKLGCPFKAQGLCFER